MKQHALLQLARDRQALRLPGYASVGDFHDAVFECDHVSPWTKSGRNADADIMIIGQDWSSSDVLAAEPVDRHVVEHGYSPHFPTNANLDNLLKRHFGVTRAACYLTNVFPYIKPGGPSGGIRLKHLVLTARRFTLPELRIVSPSLAICLGLRTFEALRRSVGRNGALRMDEAVRSPFPIGSAMVHCVAHTGARGMNNRGRPRIDQEWTSIARTLRERRWC